jgi:hypothetical protein
MTREELENLCDVVATVEVDWIVRTSFSRAIRDHDAAQRQVIEDLRRERDRWKAHHAKVVQSKREGAEKMEAHYTKVIKQHATELTCWRETAKAVGAVDDHALALHLDEQAQVIKDLQDKYEGAKLLRDSAQVEIKQQAQEIGRLNAKVEELLRRKDLIERAYRGYGTP